MSRVLLWADTETGEILVDGKPSGLSIERLHSTTDVWVNGVWVRTAMLATARPDIAALAVALPSTDGFDGMFAAGMQYCLDAIGIKP